MSVSLPTGAELKAEALELLHASHPEWYDVYLLHVIERRPQKEVAQRLHVAQGTVSKWVRRADEFITNHVLGRTHGTASSLRPLAKDLLGLAQVTGWSKENLAQIVLTGLDTAELVRSLNTAGIDVLSVAHEHFLPRSRAKVADLVVELALAHLRPYDLQMAFWQRDISLYRVFDAFLRYKDDWPVARSTELDAADTLETTD